MKKADMEREVLRTWDEYGEELKKFHGYPTSAKIIATAPEIVISSGDVKRMRKFIEYYAEETKLLKHSS